MVAVIALKYALLVSQWSCGHFLKQFHLNNTINRPYSPFNSAHYIVLYPQNGDGILTVDSVTLLHPTLHLMCTAVHGRSSIGSWFRLILKHYKLLFQFLSGPDSLCQITHRVKWRHRIYGHDTIAILWVWNDVMNWDKGRSFLSCHWNKIQPVCSRKCPWSLTCQHIGGFMIFLDFGNPSERSERALRWSGVTGEWNLSVCELECGHD